MMDVEQIPEIDSFGVEGTVCGGVLFAPCQQGMPT